MAHRLSSPLYRRLSSSFSTATKGKVPLLYKSPEINEDNGNEAVTLQVLSWGRGASGQLGGGIEEIRIYPSPVANLLFPHASFSLSPTPGKTQNQDQKDQTLHSVGISCGLFHSGLVVGGKLWMWGKGDGGRLGSGHENPAFVPTLNPHLDSVSFVALGGLHSVALTSKGEVFTWSVLFVFLDVDPILAIILDIKNFAPCQLKELNLLERKHGIEEIDK
ncbi:hypothetical protein Golob_012628 [Gossypium lobatum]|uniref:Uncharacterized protein n=1 Tax=Gossypium lobatum TaxID=34289 RepID=A0A7J8LLX4_9ROSI|nr:hypothetical protein [Gossypium lobatum]